MINVRAMGPRCARIIRCKKNRRSSHRVGLSAVASFFLVETSPTPCSARLDARAAPRRPSPRPAHPHIYQWTRTLELLVQHLDAYCVGNQSYLLPPPTRRPMSPSLSPLPWSSSSHASSLLSPSSPSSSALSLSCLSLTYHRQHHHRNRNHRLLSSFRLGGGERERERET